MLTAFRDTARWLLDSLYCVNVPVRRSSEIPLFKEEIREISFRSSYILYCNLSVLQKRQYRSSYIKSAEHEAQKLKNEYKGSLKCKP